jgi:Holliday junction resolvase
MRRRRPVGHKDSCHDAVVKELRQVGCTVMETHALGDGAPDLVVGYQGVTALVELKNGARYHQTQREKRERLSQQAEYLAAWRGGPAFVATSTEDVLRWLRRVADDGGA